MKKFICLLLASGFLLAGTAARAQRITETIAGTSLAGYTGDGGPARQASMSYPNDVCSDAAGNIYFTDQGGSRIRKMTSRNGIISTIAGGGTSSADGVPATAASMGTYHITADPAGNVYFEATNKVRKVDAVTGIVTTVAGTATAGYSGDTGPAVSAEFRSISGVSTDGLGNLYIADAGNYRIRMVDMATGIVTTIGGTGMSGTSGDGGPATAAKISPSFIAADATGNVFFQDASTYRRIDALTGIITSYTLRAMPDVVTDLSGNSGLCTGGNNLYFNEVSCSCRRMDKTTDSVFWVGGNYDIESFSDDTTSIYAWMDENQGLCTDANLNVYIADEFNNRIRKLINVTSRPTFAFGPGQTIESCAGLTTSIDNVLWITDLDPGQTETWTVLTAPVNGTLAGFPATALSNGTHTSVKPTGLTYTAATTFAGSDSFQVLVSDGTMSDVITIYVMPNGGVIAGAGLISGAPDVCTGGSITLTESVPGGTWSSTGSGVSVGATSGVVTGITNGTDYIQYAVTSSSGCVSTTGVTISVVTVGETGSLNGPDSVCVGSSITLTGFVSGGVWSTSNGLASVSGISSAVSGITPGIDTISYTTSVGSCTATTQKTITVVAPADPGLITGETTVCAGNVITLSDAVSGGVWGALNLKITVSASGVVRGEYPGTGKVSYSVNNACGTFSTTYSVAVSDCATGVNSVNQPTVITVFPNPANSALSIQWPSLPADHADIVLTDVTGRVVLTDEIADPSNAGSKVINVSALTEGVYVLMISGADVHYINKVVISR